MEQLDLRVSGMTCPACERRIEKALAQLDGIVRSAADHRRRDRRQPAARGRHGARDQPLELGKTRQNVVLAFLFNGIGIPAAATGLVYGRPPLFFQAVLSVGRPAQQPGAGKR